MYRGIILFGAAGVGDTTLGKEVARRLNYPHFDLDDYHWRWDTEIPYTVLHPREERVARLMSDISQNPHFVMSGSMWSIRKSFEPMFELAVFMTAPTEVRMERLHKREFAMFGERILPGGDMYELNIKFLNDAAQYDSGEHPLVCLKQHEDWAAELPCPVLRVDGTKAINENAESIVYYYSHSIFKRN